MNPVVLSMGMGLAFDLVGAVVANNIVQEGQEQGWDMINSHGDDSVAY